MAVNVIRTDEEGHNFPISLHEVCLPQNDADIFNKNEIDQAACTVLEFLKSKDRVIHSWGPFTKQEFFSWCNAQNKRCNLEWLTERRPMSPGSINHTGEILANIEGKVYITDYYIAGMHAAWRSSPGFQKTIIGR